MSNNRNSYYSDPMPEDHPKILNLFSFFRVMIREDLREEYGLELPVISLTRDIKSKSLKEYANNKLAIKNGEFIKFERYDSRGFTQYIFSTEDGVEIVLPEGFINKKFLFPINKSGR